MLCHAWASFDAEDLSLRAAVTSDMTNRCKVFSPKRWLWERG